MTIAALHKRQHVEYAFGAQYAARIDINLFNFAEDYDGYAMLLNPDSSPDLRRIMLDLDGPSSALPGGGDLRLCTDYTDESTRLAIDVQRCEPNNNPDLSDMELWLEAGNIPAFTTKTLFLLWGIPGGVQPDRDGPYGSEEVWDQPLGRDYRLVSHLSDSTNNTACVDSSPNNSVMTKRTAGGPAETTTSPFRSSLAQDFHNSVADWIDCTPNANFSLGNAITISFWFKADGPPVGFEKIMSRKNTFDSPTNWEVFLINGDTDGLVVQGSSGSGHGAFPSGLDVSEWTYLTATYSEADAVANINELATSAGFVAEIVDDAAWPLTLGMQAGKTDAPFHGLIDEVRLSVGAQSTENHVSDYRGMDNPGNAKIDILM